MLVYLLKRFPRLTQTFVLEELLELRRQGVPLAVVARDGAGGHEVPRAWRLDAPVDHLPAGAGPAAVAQALRRRDATHVHAHFAGWAAAAAVGTGIPFSVTAHATDIYREGLDAAAVASVLSAARTVVTVTSPARDHVRALLDRHGVPGHVVHVPNGVDLRYLPFAPGGRDPALLVSVGRLVPKKGHAVLLEAAAVLRRRGAAVRPVIVGDGPLRDQLAERARAAGFAPATTLVGALPHEATLRLLGRAAVCVFPAVVAPDGDRDALPTAITEAMALGTPVVATPVCGIPEQLGPAGVLVEPGQPEPLADALHALLADPARRASVAADARRRAEHRFDVRHTVRALRTVFAGAP